MFRQATVEDISKNRITKRHGPIYVVTRYYPRFLKKNLITAYHGSLAPKKDLLREFKDKEAELSDHNAAFETIHYESKFNLEPEAISLLGELSIAAIDGHAYLVCHCSVGQYCHRELLMILAAELFSAPIQKLSHGYETFRARLAEIGLR